MCELLGSGTLRLLLCLFLLSVPLVAQEKPCNFWRASNVAVFTINAGIQAADLALTEHRLGQGWIELNPLGQSRGARYGLKSMAVGLPIGLAYLCHRVGWHGAEKFMPVTFMVAGGIGVGYNLR